MSLDILKQYLLQNNIDFSSEQEKQLEIFAEMLLEKNKVMNLTAVRDIDETQTRHFIDSIAPLVYVSDIGHYLHNPDLERPKLADLGTGAGFPGLPLAILKPEWDFVLFDSLHKRIDFINDVISVISLSNVRTVCGRLEDTGRDISYREKFNIVLSRAVAPLRVLVELSLPFVAEGGLFVAYKGDDADNEISDAANSLDQLNGKIHDVIEYRDSDSDIRRFLVCIEKNGPCPDRYPRRTGIPSKRPL